MTSSTGREKSTTQYDPKKDHSRVPTTFDPTTRLPDVTINYNPDGTEKEIFLWKDNKMVKSPRLS